MKTALQKTVLIALSMIVGSCAEETKKTETQEAGVLPESSNSVCPKYILQNKEQNLNISILLDLSNRIEKGNQMKKDSAYLSSLTKAFLNHVKTKKLLLLEDRLQLFFNPEPSNRKINEIAEKLNIVFTKNTSKDLIEATQKLYNELPTELYHLAKADAEINGGYPGSDIWRFFEHDVRDYCIDDCHRNILVILTDGYLYHYKTIMEDGSRTSYLTPKRLDGLRLHKPGWKEEIEKKNLGFIPAATDLQQLEVLVIGIDSENENPYAQDVIEAYWHKWFLEMGIQESNIKIKSADIPKNMEKVIFDFIQS
ncbi:hypothetical protein ABV409_02205 [Flagellimonas sp. DF-77]|uniref:hypothetical protein n=1 Tax=Flagellimonas algarum TaxID=3230298 RepID=UPI0033919C74